MRLAYADPPYPGQARAHYKNDPSGLEAAEVDHADLITQLRGYDGWALSTSSPALGRLLSLAPEARVAAWVKPYCAWRQNLRVQYAWEPVLFVPVRHIRARGVPPRGSVRDWVSAPMTTRHGTHGAKPDVFARWLLDLLGAEPEDEFSDLFPGSGAVTRVWEAWRAQSLLAVWP